MADKEVRLIDKDKLIKKIKAEIDAWAKSRMCMTADELLEAIEEFEEEAQPVEHGRWIIDYAEGTKIYHAHCSECNKEPDRNIGGDYYIDKLSDYCPNCGARMAGDNNG